MTNTDMTPIRNTSSTHDPKTRNHRGRRSADADACPFPYPCVCRPSCLSVFAKAAEDDDRSISAWIRRAVEHELAN